jgi:FkbM family methyltransferase
MLITNLNRYFTTQINGCIHIGAHHAEEKKWYVENNINNVVWIEANQKYYDTIKNNVSSDLVIISGVGSENKKEFFNVSNNGQSSSLLELGSHKNHHPDVFYTNKIEIQIKRMDDLYSEYNLSPKMYNFLNMDIQGYELEALKGFGDLLNNFDYIYSEINTEEIYVGCPLITDIDLFLRKFDFVRVETKITSWGWGDAFYIKTKNNKK